MGIEIFTARLLMLLGALLLMGLCGLGFSLIWTRGQDRIPTALLLSIPIGCTLIGLALGFLSLGAQLPIYQSALPVTLICAVLSIALCIYDFRQRRADYALSAHAPSLIVFAAVLAAILILLIIPLRAADYEHTLYQENAWDAFTYMALGGYMKFGTSDIAARPDQWAALLSEYPVAQNVASFAVLHRKHSMSILAWMSTLSGLPIYLIYYPFNMICIVMTWLASLALTRQLSLPRYQQHAASALIALGFWSFLIFDISATSHLHSLSSLVLLLYAWMRVEANPAPLISRERALFGFAIAGLYSIYPETAIVATGVFGLYFLVRLYHRDLFSQVITDAAKHLVSLIVAIMFLGPTLIPTVLYLKPAASEGTYSPTIWATFIYPFLFADQNRALEALAGLWGGSLLHPISLGVSGSPIEYPILAFQYALAILLSLLALIGALIFMNRYQPDRNLSILMTTAAVYWGGAFGIIAAWDRYYTGGKLIGMGFAAVFLILFVVARKLPSRVPRYKHALSIALPTLVMLWAALNLGGSLFRTYRILTGEGIANYQKLVTPELASLAAVRRALDAHPITLIASDITNNPRVPAATLDMMLSEDYDYLQLAGLGTFWGNRPQGWLERATLPEVLVIEQENGTNYVADANAGTELYADDQFAVYAMTPADFDALLRDVDVFAPQRQPVKFGSSRWPVTVDQDDTLLLDGNNMQLFFLASGETPVQVSIDLTPNGRGSFAITHNHRSLTTLPVTADQRTTETFCLLPDTGTNHLILTPTIDSPIPYAAIHHITVTTAPCP